MKKILLVEDEKAWIGHISYILKEEYEVVVARDSDAAFAALDENQFDLILLDIRLEGSRMQGHGILREIAVLQPEAKVIMITCVSVLSVVDECFNYGARWYIEKKSNKEEILRRVKVALQDEVHLYHNYCGFTEPTERLSNSYRDGREKAALIEALLPTAVVAAALTPMTMLKSFFLPPGYISGIETVEGKVPPIVSVYDSGENVRYKPNNLLLYGFGTQEVIELQVQLQKLGIVAFVAGTEEAYMRIIKESPIACIMISADPTSALMPLWRAKIYDPRMTVSLYSPGETDNLGPAIMAKANGVFRLIDNFAQVIPVIQEMMEQAKISYAMESFKLFIDLYYEKCSWIKGWREYRISFNLQKTEALYNAGQRHSRVLTDEEIERIMYTEKYIIPNGYK